MNILFLISSAGHYGMENMLLALTRNLSRLGCRCIVGVFCDARDPHTEVAEEAQKQGLIVELVHCKGRIDRTAVQQICRLVTKYEIDVVHPHGYKADLYAYAAAYTNPVALLATSHNWPSKRLDMRAYAALDRLVLRRFDSVVAVSEPVHATLRRWGVGEEKLALIPNGVDVDRFQNAAPTLRMELGIADATLVGFVGRLVPDKGGALLLRVAKQVLTVYPNTRFLFVGEGPSRRDWEQLASELGIARNVVFSGTRKDMPNVYASLDMLVLPSLVESMPMCILEAMASSKPVIATEVGGISRVITPHETGFLVRPGDIDGIAKAILLVLEKPDLASKLGKNAHIHIRQNFSAHVMAKAYVQVYDAILANHASGASLAARVESRKQLHRASGIHQNLSTHSPSPSPKG
jgi:glycosyltransferase involved in cell wall biosynthesis